MVEIVEIEKVGEPNGLLDVKGIEDQNGPIQDDICVSFALVPQLE